MCSNRYKGVRAMVYYDGLKKIVAIAREHNNANIISIGARFTTTRRAKKAVKLFLETPFSNDERHIRRINKLDNN